MKMLKCEGLGRLLPGVLAVFLMAWPVDLQAQSARPSQELLQTYNQARAGDPGAFTALQDAAGRPEGNWAQYLVASLYLEGQVVDKDFTKVYEWGMKAALGGNARAMHLVGMLLVNGTGVERDLVRARDWFTRSADAGFALAQQHLDDMDRAAAAPAGTAPGAEVIPESAGYSAEFGEMAARPSAEDAAVIAEIRGKLGKLPTPYIYEMARRLFRSDRREGAVWYFVGALRARYDALRCTDQTAARGIVHWSRYAQDIQAYLATRPQVELPPLVEEAAAHSDRITMRTDPRWICFHGEKVAEHEKQGTSFDDWLIPDTQWPGIMAGILEASHVKR